jgi:hypothetical protein
VTDRKTDDVSEIENKIEEIGELLSHYSPPGWGFVVLLAKENNTESHTPVIYLSDLNRSSSEMVLTEALSMCRADDAGALVEVGRIERKKPH